MTTASLALPTTMEPAVTDDTMEMASPYQGHADDFDIDLDVMDDQASNTDKDMIGNDEYLEFPRGTEYEQDVANDADMIDDVAEPAMLDADDQYAETSYSVEMQYGAEKTYEAEMLEDDYDEDIDAPDPEAPVSQYQEVPVSLESADNQVTQEEHATGNNDVGEANDGNITTETLPENSAEPVHQHKDAPEEEPYYRDDENATQEPEVDEPATGPVDNNDDDANKSEQVDKQETPGDHEDSTATVERLDGHGDDAGEAQRTVDEHHEPEVEQVKKTEVDGSHGQEAEPAEQYEQGHDTTKDASLYPVKVYYQDNEISLFPPREGDSSETFFLEDESLAYAPLGELFQSCRVVLREHIGDNEVLVVDVDALNIQLNEDSLHVAKVTLCQIVDLYLQLCHNDGIDEPEPLYLTLSTKLTISAELSDLLLAAGEGKGLSEIHVWDGYHEVEEVSPDILEGDDKESNPSEEQQANATQDENHRSESPEIHGSDSSINEHQVSEYQLDEQDPEDDDAVVTSADAFEENDGYDEAKGSQEVGQSELENPELREPQSPNEASYASGEEEHTESTATITHLPAIDSTDGQQHTDGAADTAHDDQEGHDTLDEQYELEGTGYEDFPEEKPAPDTAERIDHYEEDAGNDSAHESDNHATESAIEKDFGKVLSEEHHEDIHSGALDATRQDPEDDTEETLQGDEEDVLPKSDSTGSNFSGSNTQPITDLADGITEDPLKSPKAIPNAGEDIDIPGELNDEVEDTTSFAVKEETEELPFDDEGEYLDLGITEDLDVADEGTGAKSPGPASTKRHREPEDEFELAESPTPDAKRSRSS